MNHPQFITDISPLFNNEQMRTKAGQMMPAEGMRFAGSTTTNAQINDNEDINEA